MLQQPNAKVKKFIAGGYRAAAPLKA